MAEKVIVHKVRRIAIGTVLVGFVLIVSLVDLDRVPPLWWDEGWTMNVAKNWVERGWYGQLLNGEPAPPGLSAAFPTVASVALSFKLLGVEAWQARLPIVLYTLGTLAVFYWLARQVYNGRVAWMALLWVIIMSPAPLLNPLLLGRQVLAEIPMTFYLLIGYAAFWLVLQGRRWFIIAAILAWSIGLIAKAQPLPFWLASLLVPLLIVAQRREWVVARWLLLGLIGPILGMLIWPSVQAALLQGHTQSATMASGLLSITGLVLLPEARVDAVKKLLLLGLPTVVGLIGAAWLGPQRVQFARLREPAQLARLMLMIFVGTWLLWFALFAVDWERYLFPPLFAGSLFVAVMLDDLSRRASGRGAIVKSGSALRVWRFDRRAFGRLALIVSVAITLPFVALTWARLFEPSLGRFVYEAAEFVNTRTPPDALIESYDAELMFLLQRRYRFPPDDVSVQVTQQSYFHQAVSINYDPLTADPDYVVVGPLTNNWNLYQAALNSGQFKQVYGNQRYLIYERVR